MFHSKLLSRTLLVVPALLIFTAALDAAPQKTRHSTVDLISEYSTLPADGGSITLGLYLEPDPDWHAYWINPGDAGKEPSVSWLLPDGFDVGELQFPAPHVIPYGNLITYGYDEAILLIADVSIPSGLEFGSEYEIAAKASWIVCDDQLCVPERLDLSLTLPVDGGQVDHDKLKRFARARSKIPQAVDWPARFRVTDEKVVVQVDTEEPLDNYADTYLFIESEQLVRYGTQHLEFTRDSIVFSMVAAPRADRVDRTQAILTYSDMDGASHSVALAISKDDTSSLLVSTPRASTTGFSLASPHSIGAAIIAAFLGGIILNLMPCVFPILSMKALSLVNMSQAERSFARQGGIMYIAGILVAFAVIGIFLLSMRAAGSAVGWGFQLQSPVFNVGLALLMVAIGLNLLGVYEFGTRLMGAGQGLTVGHERRSSFFIGLLAVVVATPCTAPFMAPALGWALTQPSVVAMSAILALGLGLAFPYALVSFVPTFGHIMPKPGPWMQNLRQILAFPMIVTALWLFWIVGRQLGVTSMTLSLLAGIAITFSLWAYGRSVGSNMKAIWCTIAVAGLVVCAIIVANVTKYKDLPSQNSEISAGMLGKLKIEHFDSDRVLNYITEGNPVFVYFTADWCVSCKVNEQVALASDTVAKKFNENGIKVVKGDWTTEDPEITEWLRKYDRIGVPLYLYFPSGSSLETATVLPQILLPDLVVKIIVEADSSTGILPKNTSTDSTVSSHMLQTISTVCAVGFGT